MHLMGMGYKYISQRGLFTKYVTIPKTESDTLTNILLQPFSEAYLRLNPLSTQDDADAMLHRIQKSLNNDDLGRQFYKEILLDTTNKIIDLSSPTNFIRNNTFQVATEMTCGDLSCDNFRPDITIFINGLPLAFIEVKKENNHEGVDAERKRMKTRFTNPCFRRFLNITQIMVFSNDMASQLMSGMAIVIICGLSYATLMTLYIVPILYDILFKKPPLVVDVGDDGMDDIPDDAAEYIAQSNAAQAQPEA